MIDRLRADGATVLVSTHALAEVGERVDKVAVMHKGGLLRAGSMADLRHETGADVRLRLRVKPCTTGAVLQRLPEGVRCVRRDEAHLELLVPAIPEDGRAARLSDMRMSRTWR
jgi:Cu-processing system ATP-binding protein